MTVPVVSVESVFDVSFGIRDVDNAVLLCNVKSVSSCGDTALFITDNELLPVHYRVAGNEGDIVL